MGKDFTDVGNCDITFSAYRYAFGLALIEKNAWLITTVEDVPAGRLRI